MHESTISSVLGFVVIVIIGLLIVNYFRQEDAGTTFPDGAMVENTQEESTHTVATGDTLWTIAEEYYGTGFEWTRIQEANNLANANDIEEGQVLEIPEKDQTPEVIAEATEEPEPVVVTASPSATPEVIVETTEEPAATDAATGDTYTVQRGDNLWEIAVAVYGDGYRWTDIADANDLVNPSIIHAGNVLSLPN